MSPRRISAGDHGSTYGGNLLATRAAAFFLEQLTDHGVIDHVKTVGPHFERKLRTLALKHPMIVEVRGAGLMRGLELRVDAAPVIDQAREQGLLVNRTAETVVRMLPPLHHRPAEIDRAIDILDGVLASVDVRGARMSAIHGTGGDLALRRVEGGVDGARPVSGRRAVHCGIKKAAGALDLTIIAADGRAAAAGHLHDQSGPGGAGTGLAPASRSDAADRRAAIVVNSGCANACTGDDGFANAAAHGESKRQRPLGCTPEQVLVASTGVIGVGLKMDRVVAGYSGRRGRARTRQRQRDRARHHDDRPVPEGACGQRADTARLVHRRRHGERVGHDRAEHGDDARLPDD